MLVAERSGDFRGHGEAEPLVHGIARSPELKIFFLDVVGHHHPLADPSILRQRLGGVMARTGVLEHRFSEHVDTGTPTRPLVDPFVEPSPRVIDVEFLHEPCSRFSSFSPVKLADLVVEFCEDERAVGFEGQQFAVNRSGNTEPLLDPPFPNGIEVDLILDNSKIVPLKASNFLTPGS